MCLESSSNLPKIDVSNLDKFVHAGFHFIFTMLWFFYFRNKTNPSLVKSAIIKAFLFSIVFGSIIEWAQYLFTTSRRADVLDIFANTIGASIAFVLVLILNNRAENKNL